MKNKVKILSFLSILLAISMMAKPALEINNKIPIPPKIRLAKQKTGKKNPPLVWHDDFDKAMTKAGMEYRPVMLEFMSPDCPWCSKLEKVLKEPELYPFLKELILVRINTAEDEQTPALFQITSIPVISFCSADGRELFRLNGYVDKETLLKAIQSVLNNKIVQKRSSKLTKLLKLLKNQEVPNDQWPEIMLSIGNYPKVRKDILKLIRAYSPFPKKQFVGLLKDKRLAVRLGALELLEELTGGDFNFEPWELPDSPKNTKAMEEWKKWANIETDGKIKRFSALTPERCEVLLQQAVSGDRNREHRALRLLRNSGWNCVPEIEKFIKANPGMSKGKLLKLKELEYSLLIPSSSGRDPVMLAHKLIFGKLDSRMQSIIQLKKSGLSVIPILRDLLKDKEPIIRETAVETLIVVAGYKSIPALSEHLETEKDEDVIFSVLRGIAEIKDKRTGTIFLKYLDSPNENLVISALNGLASTKYSLKKDPLLKLLKDKRWRVRVAALNAASSLKTSGISSQIRKMLKDPDDYVKYKAVEAITRIDRNKALKTLEKAFLEDDSLKGPVVAAFGSLDKKMPDSFMKGLEGKSEEVLMSITQGMDECGKEALPLALYLADNKLKDVRLPAIRFISHQGVTKGKSKYNALIIRILRQKDIDDILAVLHSFDPPHNEDVSYYNSGDMDQLLLEIEEDAENKADSTSDELIGLFDAFDGKKPKAVTKQKKKPEKAAGAKDIVDLFEAFEDEETEPTAPQTPPSPSTEPLSIQKTATADSLDNIKTAMKELFEKTSNEEIKFYTASILTMFGSEEPITYLKQSFSKQPIEIRLGILQLMQNSKKKEVMAVAYTAINDNEADIRTEGASIILNSKSPPALQKLLQTLNEQQSPLKAYDLYHYRLSEIKRNPAFKKVARKWAKEILETSAPDPINASLALYFLDKTWVKGDEETIKSYSKSDNKWLRRATYHAMGNDKSSHSQFEKEALNIIKDPAHEVRITLPKVIQSRTARSYSNRWVHFFDDKHFFSDYDYSYSFRYNRKISENIEKALRQLTKDDNNTIQMEAYFALLGCRKSIDLSEFVSVLQTFPDQHAIGDKVKEYLERNYRSLGDGFSVLLAFINKEDLSNSNIKKIFKHFNITAQKARNFRFALREGKKQEIKATFIDMAEPEEDLKAPPENMRLVYFTKKGCQDCARVQKDLTKLKEIFPEIIIETHNIAKVKSKQLNETYCERFGVPEKMRLVAPSIFGGQGYLIKKNVVMEKLIPLAAKTAKVPLAEWYNVKEEDFQVSEKRIKKRYEKKVSLWFIMLAGFLDGINPCAFATIIFFLSYLQITRKNPKEILMVGVSFILAVFLSYMAFGLGLSEILEKLYIFESFRLWFNRLMALAVFIIMIMSFYDGILCLKGKMESMALQLPDFLKERIRKTIRTGSKSSKFVIAAFVVGCIVSFLELACTGQVYAPTITYMLQTGSAYSGPVFYLTVYNLLFILPLLVIFLAAYFGLTSEGLTRVFKKHAAMVKFATALFFMGLLLLLIFNTNIF